MPDGKIGKNNNRHDWNAVLQWLVPLLIIILGIVSYSMNVRAINAANAYTNEVLRTAPFYSRSDGKVMEEKVSNLITRFDKFEGNQEKMVSKLDELIKETSNQRSRK